MPSDGAPIRALLVSYLFPPTGGAGVGRLLKLAKYLPAHGVRPAVLTASNPSVPVVDETLLRDVDPGLEILRARTLEPSYAVKRAAWQQQASGDVSRSGGHLAGLASRVGRSLMVPDPQILWQPHAQVTLARRLRSRDRDDVVLISGPPFSQFLLAPLCHAHRGCAVVLDYRDEWSTYRTRYEMMGRAGAAIGPWLERTLLKRADAVTCATDAFCDHLLEEFEFLDPDRVVTIPNGYDPDDFAAAIPPDAETPRGACAQWLGVCESSLAPPHDKFVVTYAGTVFSLTSARGFLGGVRLLHERDPKLARLLEVNFIGRVVDTEADAFAGSEALGVHQLGYLDKGSVIRKLAESHLVLCLLADVPGAERIYPAKVFELLYLGRPCLTLAPSGALAELATEHRLGSVLRPGDESTIADYLAAQLRRFQSGDYRTTSDARDIDRFDRRRQAGDFARVFRNAASRARHRPS